MAKNQRPREFYDKLKIEYVNSSMSIRELAEKHGVQARNLERHSSRGRWTEVRRKLAKSVEEQAQSLVTHERADELAQWNVDDIRIARALRAEVAANIARLSRDEVGNRRVIPLDTLRSMASIVESTQRIGRLALGASTENLAAGDNPVNAFARAMADLDTAEERTDYAAAALPRPDARTN